MTTLIDIREYLPHKLPMLLVDTISQITDTSVVTHFLIPSDCVFTSGHYFTEAGIIENVAQTCSAITGQFFFANNTSENVLGYITGIKKMVIFSLPKVQTSIHTQAILLSRFDTDNYILCTMQCNVFSNEKIIAQGEMNLFISNRVK